jgi:cytochrome P450
VDLLQTFVAAANHTTTTAITEMVRLLAVQPGWWERACNDEETWPKIIEEAVRLASPANGLWRIATREVEVGGVTIPAGGKLFVSFASANRDETVHANPNAFTPDTRVGSAHLGWGRGIHSCIGQNLARSEMMSVLRAITKSYKSIKIAPGTAPTYLPNYVRRGITSLIVEVTPR